MRFEWDENKNRQNINKHEISFEQAKTVFYDTNAIYGEDTIHSFDEERFIVIGMADGINHEITVCHCYKDKVDEVIRIISARKATSREVRMYEEGYYEN